METCAHMDWNMGSCWFAWQILQMVLAATYFHTQCLFGGKNEFSDAAMQTSDQVHFINSRLSSMAYVAEYSFHSSYTSFASLHKKRYKCKIMVPEV